MQTWQVQMELIIIFIMHFSNSQDHKVHMFYNYVILQTEHL